MPKNPPWTRDELILALDLYFQVGFTSPSNIDKVTQELSDLLNQLPIHAGEFTDEKFRNSSGVYMKLCNFLSLDPNYSGKGLASVSKLDKVIWNEFSNDRSRLQKIANLIKSEYPKIPKRRSNQIDVDEDNEFEEGKIVTKLHKYRERNSKAVKSKKMAVLLKNGKLICEVCDFEFAKVYGDIGRGFAECHHTVPVSELKPDQTIKLEDLSIVCSNCHTMIHISKPMTTIKQMREIVFQMRLRIE
jgi:5-methylcytosine-specific restriction enzyme A